MLFMNMTDRPRNDSFLQSLEKGLVVLNCFQAGTPRLTISEIEQRTGFDRAFVRRALLTFSYLGYLRSEGRHYSLTPRFLSVGYQYLGALPFWHIAEPILEELRDELNQTVSIGVLDGCDIVFVLRMPAKRFLSFDPGIGERIKAHLHSMGRVLLAEMDREAQSILLDQIDFKPYTPASMTSRTELEKELAVVREHGWSFTSEQFEEGYCGIAVPLRDAQGRAIAALNVSLAVDRDAETRAIEDFLPRLRIAARHLSTPST